MRRLYTLIFSFLLPLILLRLYWRGFKSPEYRLRWRERLGVYASASVQQVIWFHCVSVGEAEAAFPLIRRLLAEYQDRRILITTTTPTGSARVCAVLGGQVEHVFLPYDLPLILKRFFRHFGPTMAVFMEKEIWPNLFAACAERQIPLFIVNARLSERSAQAYKKIPSLVKPAFACVSCIATQTEEDRRRFIEIGATAAQLEVLGNIKFDLAIPAALIEEGQQLKRGLFANRFVWICASTHQGEEAMLLPVFSQLKQAIPSLLLMIAPRHPERFLTVQKLCQHHGFRVTLRSEHQLGLADTEIYLADSMGELKMLYAAADVAFVGGSLVPVGGHNVLEPALMGVPVVFGPQMFNFKEIAEHILAEQAAIQCLNPEQVFDAVLQIYQDKSYAAKLTARAKDFVLRNQGATSRVAELLSRRL